MGSRFDFPASCYVLNCGIKVQTDGERHITRIIGDKEHPSSQGHVCEKA